MLARRALLLAAFGVAIAPTAATADEALGLKLEGGGSSLLLTPEDIVEAAAQEDGYGGWQLYVQVTPPVAEALKEITTAAIGLPLAISFRGEVISDPVVQEVLAGGSFIVSGLDRVTAARIAVFAKKR